MELSNFASMVPAFDDLPPRDLICHFAWYLHVHRGMATFATADVTRCYKALDMVAPNVSDYLSRLSKAKPPAFIRTAKGFKLQRTIKVTLDKKLGNHPTTVLISQMLSELPTKVPDINERAFLQETIDCYRVKAYRAAIVMAWILAFDHLIRWIVADPKRLADFNTGLAKRYPRKRLAASKIEDFTGSGISERETIEACSSGKVIHSNIARILGQKLDTRNMAAHPAMVAMDEPQANDVITALVNNVVLALK